MRITRSLMMTEPCMHRPSKWKHFADRRALVGGDLLRVLAKFTAHKRRDGGYSDVARQTKTIVVRTNARKIHCAATIQTSPP
jgi:hypothetical protein